MSYLAFYLAWEIPWFLALTVKWIVFLIKRDLALW